MPEHVHLIVFPERLGAIGGTGATGSLPASANSGPPPKPTARVSDLLYAIKRPTSYRIKQDLLASGDPLIQKLTIRERPGKTTFRFWQEGSGYDRNILDHALLKKMIDYVHLNPVRRGLVDHPGEWKWSSWRHYTGESGPMDAGLPRINVLE